MPIAAQISRGGTRSGGDECAAALDQFIAAIRPIPVLAHAEAIERFRALGAADMSFRRALYSLPETAQRLVATWQRRRTDGLVTGLLIEWEKGPAAARSRQADELFEVLEEMCLALDASSGSSAGVMTQIQDLLEQRPVERGYLQEIHDELLAARESGRKLSEPLRCASRARAEWESLRADLVKHNLKLVISVAKRHRRSEISMLELIQEGTVGLVRAVEKFDPERGFRFSTYAVWWIEQAVIRAIQKSSRTVRLPTHIYERQLQLKQLERSAGTHSSGRLSVDVIADALDLSLRDADLLLTTFAPNKSLQSPFVNGGEEGSTLEESLREWTLASSTMRCAGARFEPRSRRASRSSRRASVRSRAGALASREVHPSRSRSSGGGSVSLGSGSARSRERSSTSSVASLGYALSRDALS